jgi:hypothetical protein
MWQHDFEFFVNLMNFLSKKKMIKYSLFIFIFHIYAKFQTEKKSLIMTCVFECFQSHFERITQIFEHDGCHNHFWKKYFHI